MACKPGSVLADAMDGYSSGMAVASHLKQPDPNVRAKPPVGPGPVTFLPGLAPGGVYPAILLPEMRCALTGTFFHLMRTWRSVFCGTFPEVALAGGYPAPWFRGARTFLPKGRTLQQPSSHLTICFIPVIRGNVKVFNMLASRRAGGVPFTEM